jgi:6-phosphofructokinase 1
MIELAAHDVGGIIQRGGTMPGSARCTAFKTKEGRKRGIRNPVNRGFPVNLRTKR